MVAKIGVVYLCRFAEGEEPVHRFLRSYRTHPAGFEHDLHVVFKGFPNREASDRLRALFGELLIGTIELEDTGFDIGSYAAAAKAVANSQLLFFNTFSEILANDWLAHFAKALALPGVGLVGATGSWQSVRSGYEARLLRLLRQPGWYLSRRAFARAAPADEDIGEPDDEVQVDFRRWLRRAGRIGQYPFRVYGFRGYPNPHIRTNAFMIQREIFSSLRGTVFMRKMDAYKFESGRRSMTRQIMARGLRAVVLDRWGKIYDIPEWKSSSTFWTDVQQNLLVADNQTNSYSTGSDRHRKMLRCYAWESPKSWYVM